MGVMVDAGVPVLATVGEPILVVGLVVVLLHAIKAMVTNTNRLIFFMQ